jgi:7-cyano-7-deazaguanine synthase in queuosine biosynthesis
MKEALLYSCGLDSYITKQYLEFNKHELDCIYFDLGTKYSSEEIAKIKNLPFEVKVFDNLLNMKNLERDDAYVPNRNYLLSLLANSLGYTKIWIGGTASDRVDDNSKEVFDKLSELMTYSKKEYIKIDSPFWDIYKEDAILWSLSNTNTSLFDLTTKTFSCYNPGKINQIETLSHERIIYGHLNKPNNLREFFYTTRECLSCNACFRKCASLSINGLVIPFRNKNITEKYKQEFSSGIVKTPRSITTLKYISLLESIQS